MTAPARRPRGRPRGGGVLDPDDLLEATLDALAEGGYTGLSMRAVGRTVGVSLATVQHHFPTKDELWRAAIDHLFAQSRLHRAQSAPRVLADDIAATLEQGSARPGLLAAVLTDRAPGSHERIAYVAERFAETLTQPLETLTEAATAGLLRPIDTGAFLLLMTIGLGSVGGAADAVHAIYGFDLGTAGDRDRLAASLGDIITNGLVRR